MKKKLTVYDGNCVEKPEEFVHLAVEKAKQIQYKTLLKHVDWRELKELFPHYDWGKKNGLKMKDDYSVSFLRSAIGDKWYYIVQWSSIEFFFLKPKKGCLRSIVIGKWTITYDPKSIPIRDHDYDIVHDDYDEDNGLYFTAKSMEEVLNRINELEQNGE